MVQFDAITLRDALIEQLEQPTNAIWPWGDQAPVVWDGVQAGIVLCRTADTTQALYRSMLKAKRQAALTAEPEALKAATTCLTVVTLVYEAQLWALGLQTGRTPVAVSKLAEDLGSYVLAGLAVERINHHAAECRPAQQQGKNQGQGRPSGGKPSP